jgi:hypothetical protein
VRFVIDVEPGREPLQGTVTRADGPAEEFCGVLDLLRHLERTGGNDTSGAGPATGPGRLTDPEATA